MSYNRIARYALSGESSPHFYPEGEQISMIDITMNEESEPILAGRSDLFFYKPEADKFARIPILTEKEKENPINLTKLCLVPDWGILVGTDRAGLKVLRPAQPENGNSHPGYTGSRHQAV